MTLAFPFHPHEIDEQAGESKILRRVAHLIGDWLASRTGNIHETERERLLRWQAEDAVRNEAARRLPARDPA